MEKRYGESLDHWHSKPSDDEVSLTKTEISKILYAESLRVNRLKRFNDALTLINVAIENDDTNFKYYLQKAIILENLSRFPESQKAYDDAIDLNDSDEIYENKAGMLYKWANSLHDKEKALKLIGEAIEILPADSVDAYFEKFWYLKGSIYDCLGLAIESRRCYLIAEGLTDELKELDEDINLLKNSTDTLISIAGTQFYFGFDPFAKGTILDLIKEPENEHDSDAIRVEIGGETVGYVANNDHTITDNVKRASEIKGLNPSKAEVVMIYLGQYVIEKIV